MTVRITPSLGRAQHASPLLPKLALLAVRDAGKSQTEPRRIRCKQEPDRVVVDRVAFGVGVQLPCDGGRVANRRHELDSEITSPASAGARNRPTIANENIVGTGTFM